MYFKEKDDTNIDDEFDTGINWKPILLIGGGVLIVALVIFAIIFFLTRGDKYTIKLSGEEKIILTKDSDYIEPGYSAYDRKKNDVTNQVSITSNVDTSKIGEYEILYSIDDINKVRYVSIIEGDTFIRLKGDVNMYIEQGRTYNEPGFTVVDSSGEDLTSKVKTSGKVDTSKLGTYQITYSVTNSRGVTTNKKRTIIVVEKQSITQK